GAVLIGLFVSILYQLKNPSTNTDGENPGLAAMSLLFSIFFYPNVRRWYEDAKETGTNWAWYQRPDWVLILIGILSGFVCIGAAIKAWDTYWLTGIIISLIQVAFNSFILVLTFYGGNTLRKWRENTKQVK